MGGMWNSGTNHGWAGCEACHLLLKRSERPVVPQQRNGKLTALHASLAKRSKGGIYSAPKAGIPECLVRGPVGGQN
jgi:hypothetical protein